MLIAGTDARGRPARDGRRPPRRPRRPLHGRPPRPHPGAGRGRAGPSRSTRSSCGRRASARAASTATSPCSRPKASCAAWPGVGDLARFELTEALVGHHHHLACQVCGAMTDVHLPHELERQLDQALTRLARRRGLRRSTRTCSTRSGVCRACARRIRRRPDLQRPLRATDDVRMSGRMSTDDVAVLRDPVADRVGRARSSRSCSPSLHRRNPDSAAGLPLRGRPAATRCGSRSSVALGHDARQPLPLRDRALHAVPAVLVPAHLHVPARRSRSSSAALRRDRMVWTYVLPPAVIGAGIRDLPHPAAGLPGTARAVLQDRRALHRPLRLGVRLRLDSVHVARSFRVHHHDDAGPALRTSGEYDDESTTDPAEAPSPEDVLAAVRTRSLMSKQPGRRPATKRRPQARKGRTAAAAKTAPQGHRSHRVDHRRDRDRRRRRRSCSCSPSGSKPTVDRTHHGSPGRARPRWCKKVTTIPASVIEPGRRGIVTGLPDEAARAAARRPPTASPASSTSAPSTARTARPSAGRW